MMARTVALWAGPRNGSTATMYSFAERKDTRVMDEPLFGHFLSHTGVSRPSREEVMATMPTSRAAALETLQPHPTDRVLFLKHMANHLEGLSWSNVDGPNHRHVILTRHPDGVLPSYGAHITRPTMLDLGYAHQHRILQHAEDR
ncbi:MAG: sulfotransferase family protein, partial [Bacteroidota bacterium]|nr:sulfotransferase family protein [Bacteroidota bacterium]